MGTVFNKTLCAILVTTALVACNKDDSKNNNDDLRPLNVTTATVSGIWEVDGYYLNGSQVNPANNGQLETIQYEITDKKISVVTSKNKVLTARFTAPYTIQNARIVTQDNRNSSMHDLDILNVTTNTMRVRAIPQQGPGDSTWSLRRIDVSQLVGGSVLNPTPGTQPAVDQYLQLEMITPNFKFSKTYKQLGAVNDSDVELSCVYDQTMSSFSLELRSYKTRRESRDDRDTAGRTSGNGQTQNGRTQGGRDNGGRASGVDIQGRDHRDGFDDLEAEVSIYARPVVLNMNTQYEVYNVAFGRGRNQQQSPFLATFNPNHSKTIYFSMNRDSRCDLSLNRKGDMVNVSGSCTNLDANGDRIDGRSRINLNGNCLLQTP